MLIPLVLAGYARYLKALDDNVLIPLVLAGYARYLKALDDNLKPFEPSSDPLLAELQAIVAPLEDQQASA